MGIAQRSLRGEDLAAVRSRMRSLPRRLRPGSVDGLSAEFNLTVEGTTFRVAIAEGACTVDEASPAFPAARIETDAGTWLRLDDGTLSPIDAFLQGRLDVRGNVDLAVRMHSLFEPSGRPRSHRDLEHRMVEAGPQTLSALELGEGPPVVLLHGLGATKLSWLPLLHPLGERYRVTALDFPGHGESTKARAAYTPRFFAGVIRRALDALGVDRVALVGNSMGGRVALELADRAPDRVAALVLLDPAIPGLPFPYYARLMRLVPAGMGRFPLPLRRKMVGAFIRTLFADPSRLPGQAYAAGADEFVRVYRSARARVALLASLRGLMTDKADAFWRQVGSIALPTLAMWGEDDRLVPARLGRRLVQAMPDARLVVLPRVGHAPQFEVPEITAQLVGRFLAGVYDRSPWGASAPPAEMGRVTRKQAPLGSFGS